ILLTADGRRIVRNGLALTEPAGRNSVHRDALRNQIIANRTSSTFREALFKFVAADAVRVPFDLELQALMRQDDAADFCQLLPGSGFQSVLTRIKKNVRHVHDQSSCGFASLQDYVQLLPNLFA